MNEHNAEYLSNLIKGLREVNEGVHPENAQVIAELVDRCTCLVDAVKDRDVIIRAQEAEIAALRRKVAMYENLRP